MNMDARHYRISAACDTMESAQSASFTWCGVVHFTWPSQAMWHMHTPTFNKWHKKKKKKKTLCILTHGTMRGCEWTSLAVCINDKTRDIWEKNVTIRSEI